MLNMLEFERRSSSFISTWFWYWVRKLLGKFIYELMSDSHQVEETLIVAGEFKYGYYEIYCDQIKYLRQNNKFRFLNKIISIYKFYCVVDSNTPQCVKKAMEQDVYLPDVSLRPMNKTNRFKMLFEAYTDILYAKLKRIESCGNLH